MVRLALNKKHSWDNIYEIVTANLPIRQINAMQKTNKNPRSDEIEIIKAVQELERVQP